MQKRFISIFDKNDKLIEEINIDFIDLNDLVDIFNPSASDPEMIYVYDIGEDEAEKLKKYVDLDFDFINNFYQLDCFEVEE